MSIVRVPFRKACGFGIFAFFCTLMLLGILALATMQLILVRTGEDLFFIEINITMIVILVAFSTVFDIF